jgi:hypothetical protein
MDPAGDLAPTPNRIDSVPRSALPPAGRRVPQSLADLKAATGEKPDWLVHGYLLPGAITLLTSLWKSGKSTLISVLLSRMKTGGTLAGLPVRPGRAVVISEESPSGWIERSHLLDLDGHIDWFCQPFRGKPTEADWLDLLDSTVHFHERKPFDLLVVDSLANLTPMSSENDAVQMLSTLKPLQALKARGVSSLISHHPKKGKTLPGQAARGSGALPGYVDIIIEMRALTRNPYDRRRRLRAYSRHAATPPNLIIEWNADGTDYLSLGTAHELDFERCWPAMLAIFEQAEEALTRSEILRRWPETSPAPAKMTLWKWLDRAVSEGRILVQGEGRRKDPFRYYLQGMIEKWHQNFLQDFFKRFQLEPPPNSPLVP